MHSSQTNVEMKSAGLDEYIIYLYLSVCLSIYISICLSVYLSVCVSIYMHNYIGVEWCLVWSYHPERMVRKCQKEILLPYCPEFNVDVQKMTLTFHGVENTAPPSGASHTVCNR